MAEEYKVILKNIEDWKDWISTIQMMAQGLRIWEFINPDIEPDKIPKLTQPAKPTGTVDAGDLEIFKYQMKEWSEQRSAMTKMPEKIIQTVDKSCIVFINDYSSPYAMLRDLRARMKPDDKVYQDLLLKKWKKLQTYPNRQSPENWVNEYEAYYLKLKEVGYFSGSAINVVRDFIDILPESTSSTYLSGAIQAGTDMDINTVLQKFRNHAASNLAKPGLDLSQHSLIPSFKGSQLTATTMIRRRKMTMIRRRNPDRSDQNAKDAVESILPRDVSSYFPKNDLQIGPHFRRRKRRS
jgi:hypothetical protein